MTWWSTRRILVGVVTACLWSSTGVATADSSDDGFRGSHPSEHHSVRDANGETWTLSTEPLTGAQLKELAGSSAVRSQAKGQLPPANWHACAWNAKSTKVVHSYTRIRVRHGGHIKGSTAFLECGNANFGYKHILGRHQKEWSNESWYINQNWRDLAGWSLTHILRDPDKVVYQQSRKTWCWSRAIFLYKGNKKVKTSYPKVGLGTTGKRIITAFPSGSQCKGTKVYP